MKIETRPMPFSAELVEASKRGDKTHTRRIMMPQPAYAQAVMYDGHATSAYHWPDSNPQFRAMAEIAKDCPHGKPGDLRWVQEPYRVVARDKGPGQRWGYLATVRYASDGIENVCVISDRCRDKPSARPRTSNMPGRFMSRWASRYTLRIVSVKCEKIQSMDRAAAFLEGCPREIAGPDGDIRAAHEWFVRVWDSTTNKPAHKYAANPWVYDIAYEFINAPVWLVRGGAG
ncbi:MAG: hypothetical protein COA96_16855 [SAR86 cluster bacterium]|uniref:Uncharacterized protein n=1 Tax=SAR86 cluster bacterium TaxID=2030880 RepID=A0A2A5AHP4_9GAMM|nr:MAG: hypothetical protein COA96_16855 [SAR86 cluster bacterium]